MNTTRQIWMPLALAAAAALSACGGGGGNDGAPATPSAAGPLAINADNYERVVSSTTSSATDASKSGKSGSSAASVVGAETRAVAWMQVVQGALRQALEARPAGDSLMGVDGSFACGSSGSFKFSGDANGNQRADEGESFSMEYTDCVNPDGSRYNGKMAFTVNKLNSDGVPTDIDLSFTAFAYLEEGATTELNGAMKVKDLTNLYLVTSGELRLAMTVGSQKQTETWTQFMYTESTQDGVRTETFAGNLVSSQLGNQSVEVTTPVGLQFVGEATVPNAGQVLIKGRDKSSAWVKVNDEMSVTVSVDANGDGTPEKSKNTTWNLVTGDDLV